MFIDPGGYSASCSPNLMPFALSIFQGRLSQLVRVLDLSLPFALDGAGEVRQDLQ